MNQFLREELAEILREAPLPPVTHPEISVLLIKACALLEVLRPASELAEAQTMESRAINAALSCIHEASRLARASEDTSR